MAIVFLNHSESQFLQQSISRWRRTRALIISAFMLFFTVVIIALIVNVRSLNRAEREAAINKAKELESRAELLTNRNPKDAFIGFHLAVEAEARLQNLGLHSTVATSLIAQRLEDYPQFQRIDSSEGEVIMGVSQDEEFLFLIDFDAKELIVRSGLSEKVLAKAPLPPMLTSSIKKNGTDQFHYYLPILKLNHNSNRVFITCPANLRSECHFLNSTGSLYCLVQTESGSFNLGIDQSNVQFATFNEEDTQMALHKDGKVQVVNLLTSKTIFEVGMSSAIIDMQLTSDDRYLTAMTLDSLFIFDLLMSTCAFRHKYQILSQGAQSIDYLGDGLFTTNLECSENAGREVFGSLGMFSWGGYDSTYGNPGFAEPRDVDQDHSSRFMPFKIDINNKRKPFQKNEVPPSPIPLNLSPPDSFPVPDSECNLRTLFLERPFMDSKSDYLQIYEPVFSNSPRVIVPDCDNLNYGITPESKLLYFRAPSCHSPIMLYHTSPSPTNFNQEFRTISKEVILGYDPRFLTTWAKGFVSFWTWEGELIATIKKDERYPNEFPGMLFYNTDSTIVCLATQFRAYFLDLASGSVSDEISLNRSSFLGWVSTKKYAVYKDITPDLEYHPDHGWYQGTSRWTTDFKITLWDATTHRLEWSRTFHRNVARDLQVIPSVFAGKYYFFSKDSISEDYLDHSGHYTLETIDLLKGEIQRCIIFPRGKVITGMSFENDSFSAKINFTNLDGISQGETWDLKSKKSLGPAKWRVEKKYPEIDRLLGVSQNEVAIISLTNQDTIWRRAKSRMWRIWTEQSQDCFALPTEDGIDIFSIENGDWVSSIEDVGVNTWFLSFNPVHSTLAYVDQDNYLVVIDFKTKVEMIRLPLAGFLGVESFVEKLTFSDDGERIEVRIKGADANSNFLIIKSWYWRPQKLLELACTRIPYDFTQEQKLAFLGADQTSHCNCHKAQHH